MVIEAAHARSPDIEPLARSSLRKGMLHVAGWSAGEDPQVVAQDQGLGQGCPLSPGFYALAV
eukprot:1132683-Alexandrium_andersonii.AAC.1